MHTFDRRMDRQTDTQTDFSSLDRDCISCSAVKTVAFDCPAGAIALYGSARAVTDHPSRLGVILCVDAYHRVQGNVVVTRQEFKVNWANICFPGHLPPSYTPWLRLYRSGRTVRRPIAYHQYVCEYMRERMFVLNFAITAWVLFVERSRRSAINADSCTCWFNEWTLPVYSWRMMSFYSSPLSVH